MEEFSSLGIYSYAIFDTDAYEIWHKEIQSISITSRSKITEFVFITFKGLKSERIQSADSETVDSFQLFV